MTLRTIPAKEDTVLLVGRTLALTDLEKDTFPVKHAMDSSLGPPA